MTIDRQTAIVGIASATIVVPLAFLGLAAVAWLRRNRGATLGPAFEAVLAATGAASLGTLALWTASSLITALPICGAAVLAAIMSTRRGHRMQAGWIVAGFALPWTILWFVYVVALIGGANFQPLPTWGALLTGLVVVLVGLWIVSRGDPAQATPAPPNQLGAPGTRSFGVIASAISEPSHIGPFRSTDLAAVVALVVTWFTIDLLPSPNRFINVVVAVLVGAVAASEAHIRAMPSQMRRAFEAFSWLGEWELARFRTLTGGPIPTTRAAAERWLTANPDIPATAMIRTEVLLMAKRTDEARAAVERLPVATPYERFERAALSDIVDWMAGGEGDLASLEAAVRELGPLDSDPRLRGEVSLAAARTRRLASEGLPSDATLEPLLAAREQLGRRANGQVGRALRKRLIPAFLLFGLLFGVVAQLLLSGLVP